MRTVAFYDTKTYDRQYFQNAPRFTELRPVFHEFHLTSQTAGTAHGAPAVCIFVNDRLDALCLQMLRDAGVRLVACRCAGFNNVDLAAAKSLGVAVLLRLINRYRCIIGRQQRIVPCSTPFPLSGYPVAA